MIRPPPKFTLFPYTTLFRSVDLSQLAAVGAPRASDAPTPPDTVEGRGTIAVRLDGEGRDRKSTRLNSSHVAISYAVFCLKKKKQSYSPLQPIHVEPSSAQHV